MMSTCMLRRRLNQGTLGGLLAKWRRSSIVGAKTGVDTMVIDDSHALPPITCIGTRQVRRRIKSIKQNGAAQRFGHMARLILKGQVSSSIPRVVLKAVVEE